LAHPLGKNGGHKPFLGIIDFFEKTSFIVMNGYAPRGHLFEMACCLNKLFSPVFVEVAFGAHAAHNATTTHGDIGIFMGQKDCGANALISAAGWVCAINASNNGNTQFFQFSVAKKGGTVSSPVRIHLLLIGQFYSTAIHDPYQGNMESFGHVRNSELVICLSCNPGPGHDLVVKTDAIYR
jgi:hypothetical protein